LILGATGIHGSAPAAELFAADVYCGSATGGAIDSVAEALAWLAREHVAVINVSLVGPQNATLGGVVRLMVARGHLIVAAVGNDGPAAPPLYPAAYPDVVGVTAVDARRRVLPEALRGKQVDFAAPGSDMLAAGAPGATTVVRGTSYASPIVAGLLAQKLREPDSAAARRALEALARGAMDLGARGVDTTYGSGLVGESIADRPADIRLNGRKP
jgi:subtilisin family serine protease